MASRKPVGAEHSWGQVFASGQAGAQGLQSLEARVVGGVGSMSRPAGVAWQLAFGQREPAPNCGHDVLPAPFGGLPPHSFQAGERGGISGWMLRQCQQHIVAEHPEGSPVQHIGGASAPDVELAEHRECARRKCPCAFQAERRDLRKERLGPAHPGQDLALFVHPFEPPARLQLLAQQIAELRQVTGVHRGVLEHRLAQRSLRPIGPLKPLIGSDPDVLFQHRGEADTRLVEELCGYAGIEQVGGAKSELRAKEPEIVVGIVEHLLDRGIGEEIAEAGEAGHRERIDEMGFAPGGELQQIDAVPMPVEACRFGVDGDQGFRPEAPEQRVKIRRGFDERGMDRRSRAE